MATINVPFWVGEILSDALVKTTFAEALDRIGRDFFGVPTPRKITTSHCHPNGFLATFWFGDGTYVKVLINRWDSNYGTHCDAVWVEVKTHSRDGWIRTYGWWDDGEIVTERPQKFFLNPVS